MVTNIDNWLDLKCILTNQHNFFNYQFKQIIFQLSQNYEEDGS